MPSELNRGSSEESRPRPLIWECAPIRSIRVRSRISEIFTSPIAIDESRKIQRREQNFREDTTGIVGLDVVPNAREVLINLYRKTLEEIKAVPEDEGYRKAVETFTRHRLSVCQEEEDWEMIEKRLGCGQVEELIEEAQDELKLIGHMNEWKPWGIPDDYECEVIENDAPVPKHIPLHRPGPLPEEFYKTLETVASGKLESSKKDEPPIASGESQSK